jgi:hypothetical protein
MCTEYKCYDDWYCTCVVIVVLVRGLGHLQPVVYTIALICCCLQSTVKQNVNLYSKSAV